MGKKLKILFIGNSHTYFNDMPAMVKKLAEGAGFDASVTMIAHGGWFLKQHLAEHSKEAEFNIRHGDYDYVVLQEHTHPFEEETAYLNSIRVFSEMIRNAGAVPVVYATWAKKDDAAAEPRMEELQARAARENGALLAEVGKKWWETLKKSPELNLYYTDGQHASEVGSALAAGVIWDVISTDFTR